MLIGEAYLLRATRDWLRGQMSLTELECNIEIGEDHIPAIAGKRYVAILPSGFGVGPRHDTAGGVYDYYFGCRIVCFIRMAEIARDRRRDIFLENLIGLNALVNETLFFVDWRLDIMHLATNQLQADIPTAGAFIEPLRTISADAKPRVVLPNEYDAYANTNRGTTDVVGLARGVDFGKCRRIQHVVRT